MRLKLLIFTVTLIYFKAAFGQIQIESVETEEIKKITGYDSTFNFPKEKTHSFQQLIGQEVMVLPTSRNSYKGYSGFYTKPRSGAKVYLSNDGNDYSSNYNELKSKTFEIIDYEKEKSTSYPGEYLKLKRKDNGDIAYLKCDSYLNYSKSLIVLGYYAKQKNKIVNKKYIIDESFFQYDNLIKHNIIEHTEDIWTCTDIVFDELLFSFVAKFKNSFGELVACKIDIETSLNYKCKEVMTK